MKEEILEVFYTSESFVVVLVYPKLKHPSHQIDCHDILIAYPGLIKAFCDLLKDLLMTWIAVGKNVGSSTGVGKYKMRLECLRVSETRKYFKNLLGSCQRNLKASLLGRTRLK